MVISFLLWNASICETESVLIARLLHQRMNIIMFCLIVNIATAWFVFPLIEEIFTTHFICVGSEERASMNIFSGVTLFPRLSLLLKRKVRVHFSTDRICFGLCRRDGRGGFYSKCVFLISSNTLVHVIHQNKILIVP